MLFLKMFCIAICCIASHCIIFYCLVLLIFFKYMLAVLMRTTALHLENTSRFLLLITRENQSKIWQTSIVFQGRPSRVCPMKSSGTVRNFFQPNFHFQHLVLGTNHFHFPLLILTLKRNPRDLWPLRHLIRVMITHDLTQKDLLPTYLPMYLQ